MRTTKVIPRHVDFDSNADDFDVAFLGSLGHSTTSIMRQTGLSFCQVLYRLHKAGVKRADYRNGGGFAQDVTDIVRKNGSVARKLRDNLP